MTNNLTDMTISILTQVPLLNAINAISCF